MADIRKRYNRAFGIAEFIVEGHTIRQTIDEFGVSKGTIERDLIFLAQFGYGEEAKKNMELYKRAKRQLIINSKTNAKANIKRTSC